MKKQSPILNMEEVYEEGRQSVSVAGRMEKDASCLKAISPELLNHIKDSLGSFILIGIRKDDENGEDVGAICEISHSDKCFHTMVGALNTVIKNIYKDMGIEFDVEEETLQ